MLYYCKYSNNLWSFFTTDDEDLLAVYVKIFCYKFLVDFQEKHLHPFTLAALKVKHGQQFSRAFNNLYSQTDSEGKQKVVYIDSEQQLHTIIGEEAEMLCK